MGQRQYNEVDQLVMRLDRILGARTRSSQVPERDYPAENLPRQTLNSESRRRAQGFMRVNHAGEIAAQALYQGQAFTAKSTGVQEKMRAAAEEEVDHLNWCQRRLDELGSHSSYLGPFWYAGSFAIGALAGAAGDRWSLGFVGETERQVVRHLDSHLEQLPRSDKRSRAIVEQMREDEARHATTAMEAGGRELPPGIRKLMTLCSRVMTRTAYWI